MVNSIENKNDGELVKVVILGSGFGSINAGLELSKLRKKHNLNNVKVTIISDASYFWLVTMAHEVVTGNLLPTDIMQPLRSMSVEIYNDYIQGRVKKVNFEKQIVEYELVNKVESGVSYQQEEEYDYLISALGSKTNYFNVEGAKDDSFALKTLKDVKVLKNHILHCFEDAEFLKDSEDIKKLLHFVVVGGGATGVEIAGELAEMINVSLSKRYKSVKKHARITIIHGDNQIGIKGDEWLSDELENLLNKKQIVNIACNKRVTKVTSDGAWVGDELFPSRTVIWSGGVEANKFDFKPTNAIDLNRLNQIKVSRSLNLESFKNVFVVGDQAEALDKSGNPYPMRAQFASKQGKLVGKNIISSINMEPLREFNYEDKGVILSLGKKSAVARVWGFRIKGRLAHFLYHVAYIPTLVGWRSRLRTLFSWTLNLFLPRDLSEL